MLPFDYPNNPPDFKMLTPNGRFIIGQKICLSNTGFHSNEWNPLWNINTFLIGFLSIMLDDTEHGANHIPKESSAERKYLAINSIEYNKQNYPKIIKLFTRFLDDNGNPKVNNINNTNIANTNNTNNTNTNSIIIDINSNTNDTNANNNDTNNNINITDNNNNNIIDVNANTNNNTNDNNNNNSTNNMNTNTTNTIIIEKQDNLLINNNISLNLNLEVNNIIKNIKNKNDYNKNNNRYKNTITKINKI